MHQPHTHAYKWCGWTKSIGTMSSLPLMLMMLQHDFLGSFWPILAVPRPSKPYKAFLFQLSERSYKAKVCHAASPVDAWQCNVRKLLPRYPLLHLTHGWLESCILRRRNQRRKARKERKGKEKGRRGKKQKAREEKEVKLQHDPLGCFWPVSDSSCTYVVWIQIVSFTAKSVYFNVHVLSTSLKYKSDCILFMSAYLASVLVCLKIKIS